MSHGLQDFQLFFSSLMCLPKAPFMFLTSVAGIFWNTLTCTVAAHHRKQIPPGKRPKETTSIESYGFTMMMYHIDVPFQGM